jgi:thioredoxin-dependent peroxiredoxin
MAIQLGEQLPDFSLPGLIWDGARAERGDYTLSAQRGRPVVLAVYPGDDSMVCTKQLCAYTSGLERFEELDAVVWGISPQGLDSHEAFARRHGLRMPLLADEGLGLSRTLGVTAPGIGVRRSVFLVDADGVLRWKHVALLGVTFQPVDTLVGQLSALRTG